MLVNAAYAARIPDNVDPLEVAPILCAGVTVYKGLKVTDTRPGPVGRDLGHRRPGPHSGAIRTGHGTTGGGHRRR